MKIKKITDEAILRVALSLFKAFEPVVTNIVSTIVIGKLFGNNILTSAEIDELVKKEMEIFLNNIGEK